MEDIILLAWNEHQKNVLEWIKTCKHDDIDYEYLLHGTLEVMFPDSEYDSPDFERIHKIDDGNYQGTILFLIPAKGYQPSSYYMTWVGYGSCSGCDTIESIRDYSSDHITDEQANEYWTLCLHMVQKMRLFDLYAMEVSE